MKVFRWSGLIAFAVVLTAVMLVGVFFLDNWARAGLEAGGTRIHGAEVNVAAVDLTLSPLGFEVRGVEVTDIEDPTKNLFELDTARLAMNLPKLFLGKTSIDDLTVSGMSSGTERSRPGRVIPVETREAGEPTVASRARDAAAGRASDVRNALPEPAEAVANALTQSRAAASQASTTMQESRSSVDTALGNLPDDASIAQYDQRIEALRGRSLDSLDAIRSAQTDLTALQQQALQDQLSVAAARQSANAAITNSRQALQNALDAPAKDWAALREAYPLNEASAIRAGRLLLGDEVFDRYDQARKYYNQASPWLRRLVPESSSEDAGPVRADGRFVRFETPNPTPNFLLRQALVSFEANNSPWLLSMSQVTGQQRLTGEPVRMQLARGDAGNEAMRIDAVLDRREAINMDRFDLIGRNLAFAARSLDLGGVIVDWAPGIVDMGGDITVTGDQVEGRIELSFTDSVFETQSDGQVARVLSNALQDVSDFDIGIRVSGNVRAPELQLTSDLDNRLRSALSAALQAEYDRWAQATRTRLNAEADTLTAPLRQRAEGIKNQGDAVQARADTFQQQVMDRISALEADLRNQRDRLSNAADAERRRAEEEAKRRAEDAVKDLKLPSF